MAITLEQVNRASRAEAMVLLDGLYEHSSWVAERSEERRVGKECRL